MGPPRGSHVRRAAPAPPPQDRRSRERLEPVRGRVRGARPCLLGARGGPSHPSHGEGPVTQRRLLASPSRAVRGGRRRSRRGRRGPGPAPPTGARRRPASRPPAAYPREPRGGPGRGPHGRVRRAAPGGPGDRRGPLRPRRSGHLQHRRRTGVAGPEVPAGLRGARARGPAGGAAGRTSRDHDPGHGEPAPRARGCGTRPCARRPGHGGRTQTRRGADPRRRPVRPLRRGLRGHRLPHRRRAPPLADPADRTDLRRPTGPRPRAQGGAGAPPARSPVRTGGRPRRAQPLGGHAGGGAADGRSHATQSPRR